MSDVLYQVIRLCQKKAQPIDSICQRLGISGKELKEVVKQGQADGFSVRFVDKHVSSKSPALNPGKVVTVGKATPGRKHIAIITDTHFGSLHTDTVGMAKFMTMAWDKGCRQVLVSGDILDGNKPVLVHEQSRIGFDGQAELATQFVSAGPRFEWLTIGGNHDAHFDDSIGMESGKVLAQRMQEAGVKWHHLGACLGHCIVNGLRVQLFHPHGAGSTRNSIRRTLNSRIEAMVNEVDLLVTGHFHKHTSVQAYPEKTFGVCGGTWQKQYSVFGSRMINMWDVGGTIVSYTVDKNGRASEISSAFYPSAQL